MTTANEKKCPIADVLDALDGEDRADLVAILDNGVSSTTLAAWAAAKGYKRCTVAAINAHRRRTCECF